MIKDNFDLEAFCETLSVRARNCVMRAQPETVADIVMMATVEDDYVRNMGRHTRSEVRESLIAWGIDIQDIKYYDSTEQYNRARFDVAVAIRQSEPVDNYWVYIANNARLLGYETVMRLLDLPVDALDSKIKKVYKEHLGEIPKSIDNILTAGRLYRASMSRLSKLHE